MNENQKKWIKLRLIIIFFLYISFLFVVAVRAYQLQILQQPELRRKAEQQLKHLVKLSPSRGVIYDRKHNEMAGSVEVDSVYAHPRQIIDSQKTAQCLSKVLGFDERKILKTLKSSSPFVWIERGISPAKREEIESLGLKGVHFLKENKRFYPHCEIAGHLLGFVGIDGDGLEGLEREYDRYLGGGSELLLVERDALGREILSSGTLPTASPIRNNLILTVDLNIQYLLEREIQKVVEQSHARGGMGIIINPKTGEILGLAIQPGFNPNNFNFSAPDIWRNRVVTDSFEPGSTFKVFLAASAMEEGLVSPDEIFYCENGTYRIGRRTIHDVHKYQNLTFTEVIKFSSNIGAVKVCERIDAATFYKHIRDFGFGEKTGIDLPVESPGSVRPYQRWKEIEKSTMAFGQGISVTAIQLIAGIGAIANGGSLMKPYIVKEIVNEKGECLQRNYPKLVRKVISEETAKVLTEMMIAVVSEEGTGRNARIPGFEVAGKTGTAQKVDPETGLYSWSKPVSSFMGFVPARDPRIAMVIIIDEPGGRGFGGTVAAPAFKAIAEEVLSYLNIFPEPKLIPAVASTNSPVSKDNHLEPDPDKYSNLEGFPDFTGLSIRKVLQIIKGYNLKIHIEGTGRAVAQKPSPGTPLTEGSECLVIFQPVT